jgi:hypothetical protein
MREKGGERGRDKGRDKGRERGEERESNIIKAFTDTTCVCSNHPSIHP